MQMLDFSNVEAYERALCSLLEQTVEHDTNYEVRYGLVLEAVVVADALGMKTGFRIDPQEPEWPTAYIELPTGQVSWHLPQHAKRWDGHDTEEKIRRIGAYTDSKDF